MRNIMQRTAPLFVLALMAIGTARNAQAVGTAADTAIINTASMTYTVGAVAQVPPPNASATLIVDRKINVVVSHVDGNYMTVTPGKLSAVLNFKVQNIGNSEMRFSMSAVNLAAASATSFVGLSNKTTPALAAFAEHSRIPMGYEAGSDTPVSATLGTTLNVDDYTYAYVVVDIPTTISTVNVVNGDIFAFVLKARAVFEDGTTVITQDLQDSAFHYNASHNLWNVLADGHDSWLDDADYDGVGADRSAFLITASVLALSKTFTTISDPINATNPKNIPGAIVEYVITITNNGAVAADNVTINDALTSSTTLQPAPYGAGFSCAQRSSDGGLTWAVPASVNCSSNTVSANLGTIPTGATGPTAHKLRYRALIQ